MCLKLKKKKTNIFIFVIIRSPATKNPDYVTRENIFILRNVIFLMISVKSKPFKLSCKIPKIIVL